MGIPMSSRVFAILMLFFCSAVSGAVYARRGAAPADEQTPVIVELAKAEPTAKLSEQEPKRAARSEPAIRIILPSPYEIRSN